jgi:hypothetical protein
MSEPQTARLHVDDGNSSETARHRHNTAQQAQHGDGTASTAVAAPTRTSSTTTTSTRHLLSERFNYLCDGDGSADEQRWNDSLHRIFLDILHPEDGDLDYSKRRRRSSRTVVVSRDG